MIVHENEFLIKNRTFVYTLPNIDEPIHVLTLNVRKSPNGHYKQYESKLSRHKRVATAV